MPTVLLTTYELRNGLQPRLCAKCGEPTDSSVRLTAPTPVSQLVLATLLGFCPPAFVTLAVMLKKRSSTELSMCPAHAADWRWRDRVTSSTYLWGVCPVYLAFWAALFTRIHPLGPLAIYYFVWAGWVAPAALLWSRTVRVTKVTRWGVRLSGVDPAFVAALKEDRARAADPARLPWHGDERADYDDLPD